MDIKINTHETPKYSRNIHKIPRFFNLNFSKINKEEVKNGSLHFLGKKKARIISSKINSLTVKQGVS